VNAQASWSSTRVTPGPEENTFRLRDLVLWNVHSPEACAPDPCVLHNPTDHDLTWMPLHWREDRKIFERICLCGVGHPDPDQHEFWARTGQLAQAVHGCCPDGCCRG
jgi:hypothetical protein